MRRISSFLLVATACTSSTNRDDSRVWVDLAALQQHAAQFNVTLSRIQVRIEGENLDTILREDVDPDALTFRADIPAGPTLFTMEAMQAVVDDELSEVPAYGGRHFQDLPKGTVQVILPVRPVGTVRAERIAVGSVMAPPSAVITLTSDTDTETLDVSVGRLVEAIPAGFYRVSADFGDGETYVDSVLDVTLGGLHELPAYQVQVGTRCADSSPQPLREIAPACVAIQLVASGVTAPGLQVSLNGGTPLAIDTDGNFTFPVGIEDGTLFDLAVENAPSGLTCHIPNASGTATAQMAAIDVLCGHLVSGVVHPFTGMGLTITLNGGETIAAAPGAFAFQTPVAAGGNFAVTVSAQPTSPASVPPFCSVVPATGFVQADVDFVEVHCLDEVAPLFSSNGHDWNGYVSGGPDPLAAVDAPCMGTEPGGYQGCFHGGEMRVVDLALSSCAGVTASDNLGAFAWQCDDNGGMGPARVWSSQLVDGARLSSLLTPGGWLPNAVTISTPAGDLTTPTSTWWSNPIVVDNDGGSLTNSGTINVVTQDNMAGYTIDADSVGLVVMPGTTVTANSSEAVALSGVTRAWVEGTFAAGGSFPVIATTTVSQSALVGLDISNAVDGISVFDSPKNRFEDVTLTFFGEGIALRGNSSDNRLRRLFMTGSFGSGTGVVLETPANVLEDVEVVGANVGLSVRAPQNHLERVRSTFNFQTGIEVTGLMQGAQNTTLIDIVTNNNGTPPGCCTGLQMNAVDDSRVVNFLSINDSMGLALDGVVGSVFDNITVLNSLGSGIDARNATGNRFSQVITAGGDNWGISVSPNSHNNRFVDIFAVDNTSGSLFTGLSDNNTYEGDIWVGGGSMNCRVASGIAPGLIDGNCTDSGLDGSSTYTGQTSTAILNLGDTVPVEIVGPVTDSVNLHGSRTAWDSVTDWTRFESKFRGWGIDDTWPGTPSAGPCGDTGMAMVNLFCGIYDVRLRSSSQLLNVYGIPTANDADTFTYSQPAMVPVDCAGFPGSAFTGSACEVTFLRHATEAPSSAGNRNGLCEIGDTCIVTPNVGVYAGEGPLNSLGNTGMTGMVRDVDLFAHQTNGI